MNNNNTQNNKASATLNKNSNSQKGVLTANQRRM